MAETGDSTADDSLQHCLAELMQPAEHCVQNLDKRFFTYRNPQTPDVCSEYSETTIEECSSYCPSVASSSVSTRKLITSIDRKHYEKTRKMRQLRRYRRWLMPKNAIVALNEMQGADVPEFTVNTVGQETKVELCINNVKYAVTERNKQVAKAKVSEQALRDQIFAQVAHINSSQGIQRNRTEDLPMEHLASFAMHKLLDEWRKDGFELPDSLFGPQSKTTKAANHHEYPKKLRTVADLPAAASTHHPTKLFAFMRPQTPFDDLGWNGDLINPEFTAGLLADGQYFTGIGRSKKLARKAAAANACNVLFGVVFAKGVMCD